MRRPNSKRARPSDGLSNHIQVAARCRPRNVKELARHASVVVEATTNRDVLVHAEDGDKTFSFNHVFGSEASQGQVFETLLKPVLARFLTGINCTVFAYGQTGTGKTYTMIGDSDKKLSDHSGIIPRSVRGIFDALDILGSDYSVTCQYVEIYKERIRDLLDPHTKKTITLTEDRTSKSVRLLNTEQRVITTPEHGLELLSKGSLIRTSAETDMNPESSRSHAIFTIEVSQFGDSTSGQGVIKSRLHLVDLAGSENIARSGALGVHAREAGMINQSLLALGRVINQLAEDKGHIPYRDSILTRLLQDSLGGRTFTTLVLTLSPAKEDIEETQTALNYAARANIVKNQPGLNPATSRGANIRELLELTERLQRALTAQRSIDGVVKVDQEIYNSQQVERESQKQVIDELTRRVENYESLVGDLENVKAERTQFQKALSASEKELIRAKTEVGELRDTATRSNAEIASLQAAAKDAGVRDVLLTSEIVRLRKLIEDSSSTSLALLAAHKCEAAETRDKLMNILDQSMERIKGQTSAFDSQFSAANADDLGDRAVANGVSAFRVAVARETEVLQRNISKTVDLIWSSHDRKLWEAQEILKRMAQIREGLASESSYARKFLEFARTTELQSQEVLEMDANSYRARETHLSEELVDLDSIMGLLTNLKDRMVQNSKRLHEGAKERQVHLSALGASARREVKRIDDSISQQDNQNVAILSELSELEKLLPDMSSLDPIPPAVMADVENFRAKMDSIGADLGTQYLRSRDMLKSRLQFAQKAAVHVAGTATSLIRDIQDADEKTKAAVESNSTELALQPHRLWSGSESLAQLSKNSQALLQLAHAEPQLTISIANSTTPANYADPPDMQMPNLAPNVLLSKSEEPPRARNSDFPSLHQRTPLAQLPNLSPRARGEMKTSPKHKRRRI